jgi:N-methylhydantoinase A
MLATDLRYELVRSHVSEVGRMTAAGLRRLFARLEAEGRKRLGAFAGPIGVRRSLDMRYGEQIFEIQVPLDGVDLAAPDLLARAAESFHRRHEELYAYSAPGQEVVIVNARVAVIGELEFSAAPQGGEREAAGSAPPVLVGRKLRFLPSADVGELPAASPSPPRVTASTAASTARRRRVYIGDWIDVPVHHLDGLTPGDEMKGPALFESATTTVLVRDGEHVRVTPEGWLDISLRPRVP